MCLFFFKKPNHWLPSISSLNPCPLARYVNVNRHNNMEEYIGTPIYIDVNKYLFFFFLFAVCVCVDGTLLGGLC